MGVILAIESSWNGSDAGTAYLAVEVTTALDPGPAWPVHCWRCSLLHKRFVGAGEIALLRADAAPAPPFGS